MGPNGGIRWLRVWWLLPLLWCAHAHARQQAQRHEVGPVTIEWELLAASGNQGYGVALVRVEVEPEVGDLPLDLRLRSGSADDVDLVQWRGRASPSEPASIRLLVPLFALVNDRVRGHLRTPLFEHHLNFTPPAVSPSGVRVMGGRAPRMGRTIGLFHVTPSAAPASQLLALAEQLTGQALPSLEPFGGPAPLAMGGPRNWHGAEGPPPNTSTVVSVGPGHVHVQTTGPSTAAGPSTTSSEYAVSSLETHRLPRRVLELTSAGGVLVDADAPLPDGARLSVLLEYARLGGVLFFGGLSQADLVARAPVLAPLLEERLRQARFGGEESGDNTVEVYSLGLGRLVVGEQRVLGPADAPDEATRAALWWTFEREPNWLVDSTGEWAPYSPRAELQMASVLPPGLLAAVCLVLGLVIGPINYLVVWKRRRPALLLVTVPALSVALALLIGLVGIVRLGFDIQAAGASLAVLDQRSGDVAVGESRGFFAGFTLESGLAPEPGAVVLPSLPWRGFARGPDFSLERDGALLTGDVLPSRRRARSTVLSARRTRQRLDVDFADVAPKVSNGFDAPIAELVLRAPDGSLHRAPNELAPGASVVLVPADEAELARVLALLEPGPGFALTSRLVPSSYAARLGAPSLVADLGVPLVWEDSLPAQHGVIGILDVGR